jgi:hypothetical protein
LRFGARINAETASGYVLGGYIILTTVRWGLFQDVNRKTQLDEGDKYMMTVAPN